MKNSIKNYQEVSKLNKKYVNFETKIKKAKSEIVIEILKLQVARSENQPVNNQKNCLKLQIQKRIENKLEQIAKILPDENYSMGSVIKVSCNKFIARDDRTSDYSKSCKYKPTHGFVELKLTPSEFKNSKIIHGVVTIVNSTKKNSIKKAKWFTSNDKKHTKFQLITEKGFICEYQNHTFHSVSKEECKSWLKNKKVQIAKINADQKAFNKAARLQYNFQDSLNCGNCEVGTKAFILRLRLDINKSYRGSFLLKKANEKSQSSVSFIKNMINYKRK